MGQKCRKWDRNVKNYPGKKCPGKNCPGKKCRERIITCSDGFSRSAVLLAVHECVKDLRTGKFPIVNSSFCVFVLLWVCCSLAASLSSNRLIICAKKNAKSTCSRRYVGLPADWFAISGNASQSDRPANMYVALWYKHGKPIHGRAWNNGGVVECSFPYKAAELTGAKDLGGKNPGASIQGKSQIAWLLVQLDQCGDSLSIMWNSRTEGPLLGYLDNKTEIAGFSHDKVAEQISGLNLNDMLIIVRELKGGPPGCDCADCPKTPVGPSS
uniref:Uncharacterized protein n=1 Tax=Ditylenchus dipsaci TaxID=166011 RepID=A0A915EHZ6_9BILA